MENSNKKPPIFLNLLIIKLPVTAVLSILHRLSGVLLAFSIPLVLYVLDLSVQSEASFAELRQWLSSVPFKLACLLLFWLLLHHFSAGLRYLLIDLDWFTSKSTARTSAWVVNIGVGFIVIVTGLAWLV